MAPATSRSRLSIGTWLALVGMFLAVSGAMTTGWSYVFATKTELKAVELTQADTGDQKLNEWRLQTLEIRMANQETRTSRVDKNLDSLLDRFRVTAEPSPVYQPLPDPPKPDEKSSP